MRKHKKKITIRVTSQTAFHLDQTAKKKGVTPGRVIDILVASFLKGGKAL